MTEEAAKRATNRAGLGRETRKAALRRVSANTESTIMLAFSCGKDSVCSWLVLRDYFRTIVPVYQAWVPGLQFVERSLRYYEEFFGTRIIRLPHPAWYNMMHYGLFQDPVTVQVTDAWGFGRVNFREQVARVAEDYGLPSTWCAVGISRTDSVNRRFLIDNVGFADDERTTLYPIGDWNKAQKVALLEATGCKLPVEYKVMGRSFDGMDARFVRVVKQYWPDDYERIREQFPLIDMSLYRDEVLK